MLHRIHHWTGFISIWKKNVSKIWEKHFLLLLDHTLSLIGPLHKWHLNLNNNSLYILSLILMFQDKGFFYMNVRLRVYKHCYSNIGAIYAKGSIPFSEEGGGVYFKVEFKRTAQWMYSSEYWYLILFIQSNNTDCVHTRIFWGHVYQRHPWLSVNK